MKIYVKYGLDCFLSILLFLPSANAQTELRWQALPNAPGPTGSRYDDVFFVNPSLGWVINGRGKIHRITDGGESWTPIQLFNARLNRIRMLSDTLGYAVGATVYKYSRGNITSVEPVTEFRKLFILRRTIQIRLIRPPK